LTVAPTSTPEPTVTLTPTPFPIPEWAAKTADGAKVFVENGRVYKVDVSGAKTETELSKEVFTDVFEAGDLVKQLHPEYFGEDQSKLKEELLPKGVEADKMFKKSVDGMSFISNQDGSISMFDVSSKVLDVTRVVREDGVEGIVLQTAAYGSQEPIPLVAALIESDKEITFLFDKLVFIDRSHSLDFTIVNKGEESTTGLDMDGLTSHVDGRIIEFRFVRVVRDVKKYQASLVARDFTADQMKIMLDNSGVVQESFEAYQGTKPKLSTVGAYTEGILEGVRESDKDAFLGLISAWEEVKVISQ
jgi:hypothetical protein